MIVTENEETNLTVIQIVEANSLSNNEPYINIDFQYPEKGLITVIKMNFNSLRDNTSGLYKVKLLKPFYQYESLCDTVKTICRKELLQWMSAFDSHYKIYTERRDNITLSQVQYTGRISSQTGSVGRMPFQALGGCLTCSTDRGEFSDFFRK